MNALRNWKNVDIWGQVVMLLLPVAAWTGTGDSGFMVGALYTVGFWQTISCVIHLPLQHRPWISRSRKGYNVLLLITIGCGMLEAGILLTRISGSLSFAGAILLIAMSVLLAVWYFVISILEWQRMGLTAGKEAMDIDRIGRQDQE